MINQNIPTVGRISLSPEPLHFEFSVPVTIGGCQRRLQHMISRRSGLVFGGKLDVDCVPLDEQTARVHVLKQVGFSLEVEIDARLLRTAGNATFIQGRARVARGSFAVLGLYLCLYCVAFSLLPGALSRGSALWSVPALMAVLHGICYAIAALRTVSARNELFRRFLLTLRY